MPAPNDEMELVKWQRRTKYERMLALWVNMYKYMWLHGGWTTDHKTFGISCIYQMTLSNSESLRGWGLLWFQSCLFSKDKCVGGFGPQYEF